MTILFWKTLYHWQVQTSESGVSFNFSKNQVPDAQSMQKHASILSKMLVSEILQWLQRSVSSFLPLAKMRQAVYSINMKLVWHYWRCMLSTFSGYLEELFCIIYLCCFPLNVFWSRICHVCKMCNCVGLQNNVDNVAIKYNANVTVISGCTWNLIIWNFWRNSHLISYSLETRNKTYFGVTLGHRNR